MPRKGVGGALQKALAGEREETVKRGTETLFLNEHRRAVFAQLCLRPCTTPGGVARALGISPNAAAWHFQKLLEADILLRAGEDAAYPAGLIPGSDVGLFLLLAKDAIRSSLAVVLQEPGLSVEAIAERVKATRQTVSRAMAELERAGLASVVRDGRSHRYFPTELLPTRRDENSKRALAFSEALLARVKREGIRPQVLRRTSHEFMVLLGDRPGAPVLELRTDPYATVLISSNPD